MPIPIWLVGLALTAASAAAKNKQQRTINHQQDDFAGAERVREAGRQKQRDAVLDSTLKKFQPADQAQQLDAAAAKRGRTLADTSSAGQIVPGEYVGASTAPAEVRTELASRVADYLKRGREETQKRAKLGAFGDQQFGNNVTIGRAGQELTQLGDFTRGSQGALDQEMQGALHAGDDWGLFSDVLGAAGMGASLYGFTQPGAAAPVNTDPGVDDLLWMHGGGTGPASPKFRIQ